MDTISSINSYNSSAYSTQAQRRRRRVQSQQQETFSSQVDSFKKEERNPQKELDAILKFQREARKAKENNDVKTETFERTTTQAKEEVEEQDVSYVQNMKLLKTASPYLIATGIFLNSLGLGIKIGTDVEQAKKYYSFPIAQTNQAIGLSELYDIPFSVVKMANPESSFLGDEEIIIPQKMLPFEDDIKILRSKIYVDTLSDSTIDDRVYRIHSLEEYLDSPTFPKEDKEHKKQVDFSIELYSSQIYKPDVKRGYARRIENKIAELKSKQAELCEKYTFYRDNKNCYFVPKKSMELREVKQDLDVTFASTLYKQNEERLNPNNVNLDFFGDAVVSSGNAYKITLGKTNID